MARRVTEGLHLDVSVCVCVHTQICRDREVLIPEKVLARLRTVMGIQAEAPSIRTHLEVRPAWQVRGGPVGGLDKM